MCDVNCTIGLGFTGGFIGIMLSLFFCKVICSPLEQPVAEMPTVVDMPIIIRIYLPQQDKQTS